LLNRLFRAGKARSKELDKHSILIIWLTIIVSITAGVFISITLPHPIAHSVIVGYLGLGMIVAGIAIRLTAISTLGKYFTVNLSIHEDHQIVQNGIYRTIRHPAYTGSLVSFLGLGLSFNNWITLIVIFLPVTVSLLYRIKVEEKMLIEQIGPEYESYRKRTKKLIPKIY